MKFPLNKAGAKSKNRKQGGGPSKNNPSKTSQKSGAKNVPEQKNTPKQEEIKRVTPNPKTSSDNSEPSPLASKKSGSSLSSFHNFFHSGSLQTHNQHAKPKKSIMVYNTKYHQPEKKESCGKRFLKNPCKCCCSPICTLTRCCIIIAALLIFTGLLKLIEFRDMPEHQLCVQILKTRTSDPYTPEDAEAKCYTLKDAMIVTIFFYTLAAITAGVLLLFATQISLEWTVFAFIGMLVFAVIMFITANAILCQLATSRRLSYVSNAERETAVNVETAVQIIQTMIAIFLYIYFALCAWALKLRMKEEYGRSTKKKRHQEKVAKQRKAFFRNRVRHNQINRFVPKDNSNAPARLSKPRQSNQRKSLIRRSSSELEKYEAIRRQKELESSNA